MAAKAALKVVPKVTGATSGQAEAAATADNDEEHCYALANPPSPAMEVSVEDTVEDTENASMQGNISSGESQFSVTKKAKLSADLKSVDITLSSSPVLHHKLPSRQNDDIEVRVLQVRKVVCILICMV